ncbi:hypothetical protein [Streptomyces sp. MMBL 11-3]|uniref:hypothetical protein n=1 Tax=Streptomyces sp. MMBL 11-3 TaxID=3382639 RepID=UPI0039B58B00
MKIRTAACAALLVLGAGLTACGGAHEADADTDPAACKAALREQLRDAIAAGASAAPTTRPSPCDGVDAGTLRRYTGELMADQVGDALDGSLPEATTTTGVTPECRAWIEDELRSTGGGIDFTEGSKICGNLPQDELTEVVEDVTADLLSATP